MEMFYAFSFSSPFPPSPLGIDHLLAKHVGHLFIRDPISVFAEKLEEKDVENASDHFEVQLNLPRKIKWYVSWMILFGAEYACSKCDQQSIP